MPPDQADPLTLLGLLRPRLERRVRSASLRLDWRVSDAGEGRGMANFRHRAEELGADLRIESTDAGTRLRMVFPGPAATAP